MKDMLHIHKYLPNEPLFINWILSEGWQSRLMPSAHGPIFFLKELREAKVRFFLGLSQRTRPIFCHKQLREKIGAILYRTKSQRTWTDFSSELLCVTIIGEVPLLDNVTPIFSRTEVSAHGPNFCRKQLQEKMGAILYRSKSQRIQTDFHYDSLCALGITVVMPYSR